MKRSAFAGTLKACNSIAVDKIHGSNKQIIARPCKGRIKFHAFSVKTLSLGLGIRGRCPRLFNLTPAA